MSEHDGTDGTNGLGTLDWSDDEVFIAALTPLAAEAHEALSNVIWLLKARQQTGKPPDYSGNVEAYQIVCQHLSSWPEVRRLIRELQLSMPPPEAATPWGEEKEEHARVVDILQAKAALEAKRGLPKPPPEGGPMND